MADTPHDPKKEMESWFVEGLEPTPIRIKSAMNNANSGFAYSPPADP